MAIYDSIVAGAREYPERTALLYEGETWSYGELNTATDTIAKRLIALGLQAGDRVALLFVNRPEIVCGYFACFKAGLIVVPLNTRMKGHELAYVLNHSGAKVLLAQPDLFQEIQAIRETLETVETCFLTDGGEAQTGDRAYAELLAEAGDIALPPVCDEDPALIMYTSGTTARPKGVVHAHCTIQPLVIATTADLRADRLELGAAIPPLSHIGSLCGMLLPTLYAGGSLLLIPKFDPAAIVRTIELRKVTFFWLVPAMYAALLHVPGATAQSFASVKICLSAGDAMPNAMRTQLRERLGLVPIDPCGMTEMVYTMNPSDGRARPGSIGLPLAGVEMKLLDDAGEEVAQGETGEIVARSPMLMLGYWNDPEATANAVRDGWLYTGDLARQDADGYYWFVGRKKDVIVRGGSNIAPAEVEDALLTHPDVASVSVVGVSDPILGQRVWAFIALKPDAAANEDALKAHAQARIAAYKVPETIRIVLSLPIGLTGKVHRQTLREWAEESRS